VPREVSITTPSRFSGSGPKNELKTPGVELTVSSVTLASPSSDINSSWHGYSFTPSGLQGLNNKPENIVQAQYIVGYVDKINRKVILNPLYYDYEKKLAEMEAKRKSISEKTELNSVDILIAASTAEVEASDIMDRVLGAVTNEKELDSKERN